MLYRLGMISLQLLKDQEAYHLFINSMKILEAESIFAQYWSELVDLYEAIYRCDFKNNHKEGFYHSHLA